jgi:hypothetical protein
MSRTPTDGPFGDFMADPAGAGLAAYVRCKFANPSGATHDDKPILQLAGANERADVVTVEAIPAGSVGRAKFVNAGGELWGRMSGEIASGASIYAAANGLVSATSTDALKLGTTTSRDADGVVT